MRGEKALGGKGGEGSQQQKVGEDLREEKREDLMGGNGLKISGGGKAFGGKGGS